MSREKSSLRWVWWRGLFLLMVVAALWSGWRVHGRHRFVVRNLPPRPVITAWPAGFQDGIYSGEQLAKKYLHPDAGLIALSRLYHANGFYNEAIRCYQALQILQPNEARWPHLFSLIVGGFGRLDDAVPLAQRAVVLAPTYLPARLRLGNALLKANRIPEAATVFSAALEREAGDPYALLGLATCAIAQDDWNKAREHLREAMQLHPDFVGAISLMVTVSEHFGDKAAADGASAAIGMRRYVDLPDPWLEDLFDDCYDPYRLSVAASVANQAGDRLAARRWLDRAIALAPLNHSYLRELGKMLLQSRDFTTARDYLTKAVAAEPGDSDAWALLVELLTSMNDIPGVERALISGLANCPQSAALHYTYGHRLSEAGKFERAIDELQTSQKLRPSEPAAYVELAVIYFRMERSEEAVTQLKTVLLFQPGNPLALEVLARYSIGANDEPGARHWIQQLRLQPRVAAEDLRFIAEEFLHRFNRTP